MRHLNVLLIDIYVYAYKFIYINEQFIILYYIKFYYCMVQLLSFFVFAFGGVGRVGCAVGWLLLTDTAVHCTGSFHRFFEALSDLSVQPSA